MTTMTKSKVLSRVEFDNYLVTANLNDSDIRNYINSVVIDEVIKDEFKSQSLEVKGFPPLDTSCPKYLRPTPACIFGKDGWTVRMDSDWFVD